MKKVQWIVVLAAMLALLEGPVQQAAPQLPTVRFSAEVLGGSHRPRTWLDN